MLAAKEFAAVKIAVDICNYPEVKSEILCFPSRAVSRIACIQEDVKNQWEENLENETRPLLDDLCLVTCLREKVFDFVLLTGMRMLTWATYHEWIIGFSRDFTINFFNCSLFTSKGIIDNKKAAEELMKCESLNIKQKYRLACLYCFVDQISDLFGKMSEEDKEEFYDAQEPENIVLPPLIKFWSYSEMGDVDKLRGDKNSYDYLLEIAIESGIKAAVEYCLVRTEDSKMESTLMTAALGTINNQTWQGTRAYYDWIVFQEWSYDDSDESWIPSDFYIDLLYFLYNKMTEIQKIEFLKQDLDIENIAFVKSVVYRIFTWFLNWPYQDFFMKAANLLWEFLPEIGFAYLLAEICGKIEIKKLTSKKSEKYVEDNTYDYRKLLKEFWCLSPQRFKRYVFIRDKQRNVCFNGCKAFLDKLLSLKNFTEEDRRNFELVLESGTEDEKINMIHCSEGGFLCLSLIKEEKWGILDVFLSNCLTTQDQVQKFQKCLSITKGAQELFIYLAEKQRWSAVEFFVKWSSLSEEELIQLKGKMIRSGDVINACKDIIEFNHSVKNVETLCEWVFTSTDELKEFKKELVGSYEVLKCSKKLVFEEKLEVVDELITWCLSSEAEINAFKKSLASKWGISIIQHFLDYLGEAYAYGCKWEQVEIFLTWCFSSEDEINNFKRRIWHEKSALDIHFQLILTCQWQEADTFISWLGLSSDEIIELKEQSLYENMDRFNILIQISDPDMFIDYLGGKWENIECIFRWCLKDKEAILEFQERYQEEYGFGPSHEEEWYMLSDVHNN